MLLFREANRRSPAHLPDDRFLDYVGSWQTTHPLCSLFLTKLFDLPGCAERDIAMMVVARGP